VSASSAKLIVALPSKGRLQAQSVDFLSECGFDVRRRGNGRDYVTSLAGLDDVSVIYVRPDEIPARVEQADAHIGITGEDLYREYGDGQPASFLLMPNLGFGAARLVVAVPQSWVDVSTLNDLDEAAMVFHQKHGRTLRVATKFPRLTRAFFAEQGIVEYSLVGSSGATEGAPAAGVADFVVDLTSTGTTLAENHLKEIAGGTVLQTEACLVGSLRAPWSKRATAALEHLVEQIEARKRATSQLVLRFSVPPRKGAAIRRELSGTYNCVPISWNGNGDASAAGGVGFDEALCPRMRLYDVVKYLKSQGATAIVFDRGEFIFERSSPAFETFSRMLEGRVAAAAAKSPAEN